MTGLSHNPDQARKQQHWHCLQEHLVNVELELELAGAEDPKSERKERRVASVWSEWAENSDESRAVLVVMWCHEKWCLGCWWMVAKRSSNPWNCKCFCQNLPTKDSFSWKKKSCFVLFFFFCDLIFAWWEWGVRNNKQWMKHIKNSCIFFSQTHWLCCPISLTACNNQMVVSSCVKRTSQTWKQSNSQQKHEGVVQCQRNVTVRLLFRSSRKKLPFHRNQAANTQIHSKVPRSREFRLNNSLLRTIRMCLFCGEMTK